MTTATLTGRRGVWAAPEALTGAELAALARRTEELGYSTLWLGETFGRDPFAQAAHLGAATSSIGLATGIANVYNRHPGAMKQGAHTLAEQTGGRFTLGLGVSSPVIVEKMRGLDYRRPLSFMRSYLDAMEEARYTAAAPAEPPPVVLAALGPRMLELAAERTAGAHSYNVTPEHTEAARRVMGPDAGLHVEQKVMLTGDAEQARATGAGVLKFYTRAPGYRNCWLSLGFSESDIDEPSPRFLDAMVAWGDAAAIEARLGEHLEAGATSVCVQVLHPAAGVGAFDYDALEALAPRPAAPPAGSPPS